LWGDFDDAEEVTGLRKMSLGELNLQVECGPVTVLEKLIEIEWEKEIAHIVLKSVHPEGRNTSIIIGSFERMQFRRRIIEPVNMNSSNQYHNNSKVNKITSLRKIQIPS
jgi:hypothetical protein